MRRCLPNPISAMAADRGDAALPITRGTVADPGAHHTHQSSSRAADAAAAAAGVGPGQPWPLGATLLEGGVNFAVFASDVEQVEVCLFDATGTREVRRVPLPACTDDVWHGFVPGLAAGARYGDDTVLVFTAKMLAG